MAPAGKPDMAPAGKPNNGTTKKESSDSAPQASALDRWLLPIVGIILAILVGYHYQERTQVTTQPVAVASAKSSQGAGSATVAKSTSPRPPEAKPPEAKPATKERKTNPSVNPFSLEIPRVTVEELKANKTLRSGHHAFVLTDAVQGLWNAENWTLSQLQQKIPFEWVDYYPENMRNILNKPFLFNLSEAVPRFKEPKGTNPSRYMQMRISLKGWKRLRKDLAPMPELPNFWDDNTWLRQCMLKDGKPDEDAISNFYTTNQWKFLLIGEKGTEMFLHKDGTAATSWQAIVKGRKKWTLCPNTESRYMEVGIDTYNPDYRRFPQFARAHCGQTVVGVGEIVYYPAYWWHHTYQLDTPTIAYTGALVGTEAEYDSKDDLGGDTKAHRQFYQDLMRKCGECWTKGKQERHCDDISQQWPGAAPPPLKRVCFKYFPQCYKLWDEHAKQMHPDSRAFDSSTAGTFA